MIKRLTTILTVILLCLWLPLQGMAISTPNTFTSGTIIQSAKVNENFDDAYAELTKIEANRVHAADYNSGALTNTTISAAITDIGNTTPKILHLKAGNWVLSGNINTSTTKILVEMAHGAYFSGTGNFTGTVIAEPAQQIFSSTYTGIVLLGNKEVYAEWFGAIAGDAIDDTEPIQSAISSLTTGGVVQLLKGNYSTDTALTYISKVIVKGMGREATTITNSTSASVISGTGTEGSFINLLGNITEGDATVNVTSTSFTAGDWFKIKSDALFCATEASSVQGEIHRVDSIPDPTHINTLEDIWDSYTTANTGRVAKITFVENIGLEDLTIVRDNTDATKYGWLFTRCKNVNIKNVGIRGLRGSGNAFFDCINVNVNNVYIPEAYNSSIAQNYGVLIANASQYVNITDSYFSKMRHGITSGGNSDGGIPRFVNYSQNILQYCTLDAHGNAENIKINGNTLINGAINGVTGRNMEVTNNKIYYSDNISILTQTDAIRVLGSAQNTLIANNTIINAVVGINLYTAYDRAGILTIRGNKFQNCSQGITFNSVDWSNVIIESNDFNKTDYNIRLLGAAATYNDITIKNNIFNGSNGAAISQISTGTGTFNRLVVSNNIFKYGTAQGVSLAGTFDRSSISNNIFKNLNQGASASYSTGAGLVISGTFNNGEIVGNIISDSQGNMMTGIATNVTTATFSGNVIKDNIIKDMVTNGIHFNNVTTDLWNPQYNTWLNNYDDNPQRVELQLQRSLYNTAAPVAGTWVQDDIIWNSNPVAGGPLGWICITGGTPGTWVAFASLDLSATTTWDAGSIADGDEEMKEVTVTGAALGDIAICSMSVDVADLALTCSVTATNTVTASLLNNTGGAIDLASGTLKAKIIK